MPGIQASHISWGQPVAGTARELLTDPHSPDQINERKSAVGSASEFLRQVLADGPVPSKTVWSSAKDAGVSVASVRRASEAMMVGKTKAPDGSWYWKLHVLPTQPAQHVQVPNVEQHEQHEQEFLKSDCQLLGDQPDPPHLDQEADAEQQDQVEHSTGNDDADAGLTADVERF